MAATNSFTCETFGCFQYHSNTQVPIRAWVKAVEDFELLLSASEVELFVEAELHRLLQGVDRVLSGLQEDNHVRVGGLRLDQVGRIVGGAERRQRSAELGAVVGLERRLETLLQRMTEGVVGREKIPLLAVLVGSVFETEFVSMRVVLQTRNTFQ